MTGKSTLKKPGKNSEMILLPCAVEAVWLSL